MFLPGYTFIQQNSKTNAGRVGMFVKNFLNFEVTHSYDLNLDGCEEIWVNVKISKGEKMFGTIYRHQGHNIAQFQTLLETTLKALNKDKRTYYMCGDININLLQNDVNTQTKCYNNMLFSLGCLSLSKYPTTIAPHSATLLDHIYTNNFLYPIISHILSNDISDHFPILI